jgi:predicted aspartyl protease
MCALVRFAGLVAAAAAMSFGALVVAKGATGPVYRLNLGPFVVPPSRTVGLIVRARVNGGPLLRLLLDSGANTITVDPRAAAKSGCAGGTDLDLVGAGAQAATIVKQTRAATVEIGGLVLRDLPVLISSKPVAEGIQGALPLSLFSAFLIRLDVPGKTLDLLPYPEASPDGSGDLHALSSNSLLFVKGTVNERREGYFLLDTGASYSAVSKTVARELKFSEALLERVPLQAGTTDLDAPLVGSGVRLRFGRTTIGASPVVAINLSVASRYNNLNVAGLLGFPALSRSVLVVNYRDGLVRIDSK